MAARTVFYAVGEIGCRLVAVALYIAETVAYLILRQIYRETTVVAQHYLQC